VEKLAPFVSAAARPRAQTSAGQATLVSTPHASPKALPVKRADTIDLIERAARPRQISTLVAVTLIIVLSLVAGLAAYVLRLRMAAPEAAAEPARSQHLTGPRP
jgi:hypothetical protein